MKVDYTETPKSRVTKTCCLWRNKRKSRKRLSVKSLRKIFLGKLGLRLGKNINCEVIGGSQATLPLKERSHLMWVSDT